MSTKDRCPLFKLIESNYGYYLNIYYLALFRLIVASGYNNLKWDLFEIICEDEHFCVACKEADSTMTIVRYMGFCQPDRYFFVQWNKWEDRPSIIKEVFPKQ